jgi:hypothetical protein
MVKKILSFTDLWRKWPKVLSVTQGFKPKNTHSKVWLESICGDFYAHRILAKGSKQVGMSQCICKACMDKIQSHTKKSTKKFITVCCSKCDVGLCMEDYFDAYHLRVNYGE